VSGLGAWPALPAHPLRHPVSRRARLAVDRGRRGGELAHPRPRRAAGDAPSDRTS